MIFFVDSVLQNKKTKNLQRREKTVHTQFELWPTSQVTSPQPKVWKTLTCQQKQDVINALADLIDRMVRQGNIDQEESHER